MDERVSSARDLGGCFKASTNQMAAPMYVHEMQGKAREAL